MITDEDLVSQALGGDDAAFGTLVARYRERLLRFLLSRSATRHDAEDALQDAFVNAYRYLHSFDSRWRFSTWIYRIAIRCLARQPKAEWVSTDEWSDTDSDPLAACVVQSQRENLWLTARQALSSDAYTALWLRYLEDQSVKEVAAAMGKTESWVKVTLMRARDRLRPMLDEARHVEEGEVYG